MSYRQLVPSRRIQQVNQAPVRPQRTFVFYWMIAQRRAQWNYGLQRAVERAVELEKPLVVFEALRAGYPWASERLHRFVLQGMADNREQLSKSPVCYYPYVEPKHGAGSGLLESLAEKAAVVVTDEFPCFFLPRMVAAVGERLDVRLEQVDSNGILPLRATSKDYPTAYAFRRFLQAELRPYLAERPKQNPLARTKLPALEQLPPAMLKRWPMADDKLLAAASGRLSKLPIDHEVGPAAFDGGAAAAQSTWRCFLKERLARYVDERNEPLAAATSGLSPYLHFGHISSHQIVAELLDHEDWSEDQLASKAKGSREGWWGMSPAAEAFLDQIITWRELGYNFCFQRTDYDQYDSLPDWARATLEAHASDQRKHIYSCEEFATGATHDPLWNAAQMQLVREGQMHNYLRMLWGKKILEWSPSPSDALSTMIELNNRFAVDGRNPNSYSGICWTLGRYDRPWGPERPIFGKIRYMSSENTARKLGHIDEYVERYADADGSDS